MIMAAVGDSVTLQCFRLGKENTGSIVWYKQKVGQEPRALVTVNHDLFFEKQFSSRRFSIGKEERGFHLKITDVEPSDEAMYYCGDVEFLPAFGKGTFLSVKGTIILYSTQAKKITRQAAMMQYHGAGRVEGHAHGSSISSLVVLWLNWGLNPNFRVNNLQA